MRNFVSVMLAAVLLAALLLPSTRRWLRGARAPSRSSGRNPLSFPNDSNNTTCAFQKNGIEINPPRGSADKTTVIRVAAFHFLFAKKRGITANIFILGDFLTLVDHFGKQNKVSFYKKNYILSLPRIKKGNKEISKFPCLRATRPLRSLLFGGALECSVSFLRKYEYFVCSLIRTPLKMGRCLHRFEREEGGEDGGLPIGLKNTEMCLDASRILWILELYSYVCFYEMYYRRKKKYTYVIMTLVLNVN